MLGWLKNIIMVSLSEPGPSINCDYFRWRAFNVVVENGQESVNFPWTVA